jgi:alkylation response protein AidB-like acyl-CoA dehydrogenase
MSEDYVSLARSLAPLLREAGQEADRDRRLPQRAATAMAEAGLYRLPVAASFGGIEADPFTLVNVIEAISEADAAAGWNLMIGIETAGISSGWISAEGGDLIWGKDPDTIMCGALRTTGHARKADGGWRLSGQWPFASGCHNAQWFWGGALAHDAGGEPMRNERGVHRPMQLCVDTSQVEILDTWKVAGLRGSGSHDVAVHDVFVPDHLTTDVYGSPPLQQTPLFVYPLISRLCLTKIGVATGITRAAIDAFVELATVKTPYTATQLLRERPQAQLAAAEAEALLGAGRAFIMEAVRQMWTEVSASREPSPELRVRQRLAASFCTDACARAVDTIVRAAGSTANFLDSPLERHARDVRVVQSHVTVAPAVFETAGRAMFGLPVAPGSF